MQVNNVTVPDAGSTKQYIPDSIGGWMYVVTTTITVDMQSLNDVQSKLAEAKSQLADAQALVAELEPQATAFETALVARMPVAERTIQLDTASQASSTPVSL